MVFLSERGIELKWKVGCGDLVDMMRRDWLENVEDEMEISRREWKRD